MTWAQLELFSLETRDEAVLGLRLPAAPSHLEPQGSEKAVALVVMRPLGLGELQQVCCCLLGEMMSQLPCSLVAWMAWTVRMAVSAPRLAVAGSPRLLPLH